MSEYLKPTDEGAFTDKVKLSPDRIAELLKSSVVECAQCHGYGGWNLKVNEYGPGKHFQTSCNNCNGWGYVRESQGDHIHEWGKGKYISMCYTRYVCKGCGQSMDVDSSD